MFRLDTVIVNRLEPDRPSAISPWARNKSGRAKASSRLNEINNLLDQQQHQVTPGRRLLLAHYHHRHHALVLFFSHGLIAWLFLDEHSNQLINVSLDRYLIGRLKSDHVVDIVYREDKAIIISYSEPLLSCVFLCSSSGDHCRPISDNGHKLKHNPFVRIVDADLDIPSTRRARRHLVLPPKSSDTEPDPVVLVWWQLSSGHVSPWSAPVRSERDLSNLLVYSHVDRALECIGHGSITTEIVKAFFSLRDRNLVLVASLDDQYRSLLLTALRIGPDPVDAQPLRTEYTLRIALPGPFVDLDLAVGGQERLLILCEDRTVLVYRIADRNMLTMRTSMDCERSHIICDRNDAFFMVADRFGQLLIYDYALGVISANYDDPRYCRHLDQVDSLQQLQMVSSDLLLLKYLTTGGVNQASSKSESITTFSLVQLPRGLDPVGLIKVYLRNDRVNEALENLASLNWSIDPYRAYSALCICFNWLLRKPLNPVRERQLERTLAVYFRPAQPLPQSVRSEYQLGMYLLAKRFFMHLYRYQSLEKAFLLALDLNNRQLFLLLHRLAIERQDQKLLEVSLARAKLCRPRRKRATGSGSNQERITSCSESDHRPKTSTPTAQVHRNFNNNRILPPSAMVNNGRPPMPIPRTSVAARPTPIYEPSISRTPSPLPPPLPNSPPPIERSSKPMAARALSVPSPKPTEQPYPSQVSNPAASNAAALYFNESQVPPSTPSAAGLPRPPKLPPRPDQLNGTSLPTDISPPSLPPRTYLKDRPASSSYHNQSQAQAKPLALPVHQLPNLLSKNPLTRDTTDVFLDQPRPFVNAKLSLFSTTESQTAPPAPVLANPPSPTLSPTTTVESPNDQKPRIECIHFGIV